MKAVASIAVMIVVMPILSSAMLILYDPASWGGALTLQNTLMFAVFGVVTVPLWFTYAPFLVATPIVMGKLPANSWFFTASVSRCLGIAAVSGIISGILILSPCVISASTESAKLALNWAWAGGMSGGGTATIIASIYRFWKS